MEKEGEENKNKESSSSGTNRLKISQSVWYVFCSALAVGIEKALLAGENHKAKMLQFVLQEHQQACHELK